MKKFQSIEQFKNVIRQVKDIVSFGGLDEAGNVIRVKSELPTLKFTATTKIHGTNAGIRKDKDGLIHFQSRERELSIESDNAGFCIWSMSKTEIFSDIFKLLECVVNPAGNANYDSLVIFGEWFGSNIQKGVAVSQIPEKKFAIFELHVCSGEGRIRITPEFLVPLAEKLNTNGIYLIGQFGQWEFEIDFEKPELAQAEFVSLLEKIEAECPVGKFFGVSGIGEGFVITHMSEKFPLLQAKIKGEKHSNSKVKTIVPIDIEKYNRLQDFVADETQPARMEQGIAYLKEMNIPFEQSSVGAYIKWVTGDIIKECQLEIVENQFDPKAIAKSAGNIARTYFFNYLDSIE